MEDTAQCGASGFKWSKVLLEKQPDSQLVKFPAFYGNRSFITAFTGVRHLSLS
jgi:hypothetical protein